MNLRDKLLKTSNRVYGKVNVPGWGEVSIRCLTLAEVKRFEAAVKDDAVRGTLYAVVLAVCDDAGARIFSDDDLDSLTESVSLDTILTVANAVTEQLTSSANVDDAKKNLNPTDN